MSEKEIPLSEILLKIYLFFNRKIKLIGLFLVIGVMAALTFHYSRSPLYTSQGQICSKLVDIEKVEKKLSTLSDIIENKDYTALSAALQVPKNKALHFRAITFVNTSQENITPPDNTSNNLTESCINISVALSDSVNKSWVSVAIMDFIRNEEYFKKLEKASSERNEALLKKYSQELIEIDSFQTALFHVVSSLESGNTKGLMLSNIDLDAAQMSRRIQDLKEAKLSGKVAYYTEKPLQWHIEKSNNLYALISIVFLFTIVGIVISLIVYINTILKSQGLL